MRWSWSWRLNKHTHLNTYTNHFERVQREKKTKISPSKCTNNIDHAFVKRDCHHRKWCVCWRTHNYAANVYALAPFFSFSTHVPKIYHTTFFYLFCLWNDHPLFNQHEKKSNNDLTFLFSWKVTLFDFR